MPRRKRHDTIRELHREAIRRQSGLLLSTIDAAALSLSYFTPHGQAWRNPQGAYPDGEHPSRPAPRFPTLELDTG